MVPRMDTHRIPVVKQSYHDCAWCWYSLHPDRSFPAGRSASCCQEHQAWVVTQLAQARQRRDEAKNDRASKISEGGTRA